MSKIGDFFKGFLSKAAADPVSTLTGLCMVAGGAYAISQGGVAAVPLAAPLIAKGIHSIGTDTSGNEAPAAVKAEQVVTVAAAIAPQVDPIRKAIEAEGDKAKEQKVNDLLTAINAILPPAADQPIPANDMNGKPIN